MNLIASSDIYAYIVDKNKMIKNNSLFQSLKKLYRKVMVNLSKLYQSTNIDERIHETFEFYLKVSNKTRNSTCDSLI